MKFYEVLQGRVVVGRFLHRKNAIAHCKKFNTRVFVAAVSIEERTFSDCTEEEEKVDSDWLDDHTNEWGGV